MCVTPILLPTGQTVACRNCNRCRDNRIKDWIGRCIAESRTAVATHSITLTYAPLVRGGVKIDRHERTAVLTYSDVQKFLKILRTSGYPVRFLICGEFGKRKGRAHWHGILFWQRKAPEWAVLEKNFNHSSWPHGHMFWEEPSYKAVGYVCKYVQKDVGDEQAQGKLTMSKEPAIGGLYFRDLARRYVEQGIAPQAPFYRFPEAKKKNGQPVEFYMSGVTADQFREAYVLAFYDRYPGRHLPNSEFVEEWLDKQVPEWRSSEKLAKLEKEAERLKKIRALNERAEEQARYRAWHNKYYFGANMAGFYDTNWRPEHEREDQEACPKGRATGESEYISELYREFEERERAQKLADFHRYGTAPF